MFRFSSATGVDIGRFSSRITEADVHGEAIAVKNPVELLIQEMM